MAYTANPVNFDGTNDYLIFTGNLAGIADGTILLLSGWFRVTATAGTSRRIFSILSGTQSRLALIRESTNVLRLIGRQFANTSILDVSTTQTFTDNNWHHFAISLDLDSTATRSFYIDGVSASVTWTIYNRAAGIIDFAPTTSQTTVVGRAITATPDLWTGDLADLYFTLPASYFDLSDPANLAKLIADGVPVDPGAGGAAVTGTAPLVLLSGATASWHTNDGTGGGFTVTGALTDGSVPLPVAANEVALDTGNVAIAGTDIASAAVVQVDSGVATASGVELAASLVTPLDTVAVSLAGSDLAILSPATLQLDQGIWTVAGADVGIIQAGATTIVLDGGSIVIGAVKIRISTSTITVTGTELATNDRRTLDAGSLLTITGADLSPAVTQWTPVLDSGTVLVSGQDIITAVPRTTALDTGAVTVTGADLFEPLVVPLDQAGYDDAVVLLRQAAAKAAIAALIEAKLAELDAQRWWQRYNVGFADHGQTFNVEVSTGQTFTAAA